VQYKGDIQDYIVRMEALNYQVCLSGIAWREALHSGFNEDMKDRLSFSKLTPNDDAECELLLRQVGHAYERRLQEKNKHHHNDHKPKDKKNKRNRDDDGDKGSDSMKPRTEKKGSKQIDTDKGVALRAFRILCWKLEHSVKSVCAAVLRSIDGCSVRTLSNSRPTERRIRSLKRRLLFRKL
jgi:hypothetical protein